MTDLTIFTHLFEKQPLKWQQLKYSPYKAEHVNALYRGCKELLDIPHRFVCITNTPEGIECETMRSWQPTFINGHDSCYHRLRMFDPWFQNKVGTKYMALLDLDVVLLSNITRPFTFAMKHDFAIMRGSKWTTSEGLCNHYNGGFWVSEVGARDFWRGWMQNKSIEKWQRKFRMPDGRKAIGSDQVIISIASADREVTIGEEHGVAQFRHYRGQRQKDVCMVFFAGSSKPWSRSTIMTKPELYEAWARFHLPK